MTAVTALAGLGLAGPAGASHVTCGQTITTSTTLDSDVGPCPNNGIIVGANNITLNLNGFRVFGTPNTGDGAGVLLPQRTGVTVTNGTVSDFDGGVVIANGSGNTVSRVTARDNLGSSPSSGPGTAYGDGILLEGTSNNSIIGNTTLRNGPFSGIGLIEFNDSDHPTFTFQPTANNLVRGNQVYDNVFCRQSGTCDNDGIRVEPLAGPGNIIESNQVGRNGLDGISLFADADQNTVRFNSVFANGFRGAVTGDGIRVFGSSNRVEGNQVVNNARGGLTVGRRPALGSGSLPNCVQPTNPAGRPCPGNVSGNPRGQNNQLLRNGTSGNGLLDLYDSNPNCDNNVWRGNTYQTASPACTTTP